MIAAAFEVFVRGAQGVEVETVVSGSPDKRDGIRYWLVVGGGPGSLFAGFSGTGVQAHCGQVDGKFGLAGLDTACDLVQPCSIPFNPIGTIHDADGEFLFFRSFPLIAGGSGGVWNDGQS